MRLTSPVFEHEESIPERYTCTGEDVNPPLEINNVPSDAKSLVLICDDPDAATDPNGPGHDFDHWILWNINPKSRSIQENYTPPNTTVGENSAGKQEYMGPCPPTGKHRYFFKLYALDTELDLPEGSDKEDLEDGLAGHVIAQTELIGTYQKP